jgi:PAS domain-containing protein
VDDGTWYKLRVLPYRTSGNVIDGVVATFVDITEQKRAAQAYEQARNFAEAIVKTIREPLIVLDADLKVVSANDAFYADFQVKPSETEGRLIYELGNRQWDIPKLRELLEKIVPENTRFDGFMVEHEFPRIGFRKMVLNARQTVRDEEQTGNILLAFEDVTDSAERQRKGEHEPDERKQHDDG